MKVKPIDLQVTPCGDLVMCCPQCRKPIVITSLGGFPPAECSFCGAEFDWGEEE